MSRRPPPDPAPDPGAARGPGRGAGPGPASGPDPRPGAVSGAAPAAASGPASGSPPDPAAGAGPASDATPDPALGPAPGATAPPQARPDPAAPEQRPPATAPASTAEGRPLPDGALPDAALPDAALLEAVLEASWPAAGLRRLGPFSLRDGAGGGRRVSAATAEAPVSEAALEAALAALAGQGGPALFRLRPEACAWDAALDALLAARGFRRADPTLFYAAPVAALAPEPLPGLRVFALWPPLAVQRLLWSEGGIGPERLAVMARAAAPHAALMARQDDRVAGTAFVALHGAVAMLHAVEVTAPLRRRGAARNLARAAAEWAAGHGARWLALAVTEANTPARALYAGLGMRQAGGYHYRIAPD